MCVLMGTDGFRGVSSSCPAPFFAFKITLRLCLTVRHAHVHADLEFLLQLSFSQNYIHVCVCTFNLMLTKGRNVESSAVWSESSVSQGAWTSRKNRGPRRLMQGPEGAREPERRPCNLGWWQRGPRVCSLGRLGSQTSGHPHCQSERGHPVVLQLAFFMSSCHVANFLRRGSQISKLGKDSEMMLKYNIYYCLPFLFIVI